MKLFSSLFTCGYSPVPLLFAAVGLGSQRVSKKEMYWQRNRFYSRVYCKCVEYSASFLDKKGETE